MSVAALDRNFWRYSGCGRSLLLRVGRVGLGGDGAAGLSQSSYF